MRPIKKGSTDQSVVIRIIDSTDGTPETAVEHNTSGIDLWYRREQEVKVSITEAALASLDAAHSDGGIEHIGDGYYRLDLPDAAVAAGSGENGVMIGGTVTDMIVIGSYIPLVDYDPYDIVRLGLTALPNAAADAAGGIPISDAGGLDMDAILSGISNISSVGAATNKTTASYTLTTGTQSANAYTDTLALNGTKHTHTDDNAEMDLYYEFEIGGGTPTSVTVTGALTGNNDDLEVLAYDWINTAWVQLGSIAGKVSSDNEVNSYTLMTTMVGTGANLGKVRIRFWDNSYTLSTATLYIDQIFVSFAQGSGDYALGAIWVDTNASNTNTVSGVDGVSTNPVSTWAAAKTLSTNLNIDKFYIINGSSITLDASTTNKTFIGQHYDLALGGQDISGSHFEEAAISGIGTETGTETHFKDCHIEGATTLGLAHLTRCSLTGGQTLTLAGADNFIFESCYASGGSTPPVIDFNDQGATVGMRGWCGGLKVKTMSSSDKLTMQGKGKLTIDVTCDDGGTIGLQGNIVILDQVSGSWTGTLNDDARIDVDQINAECDTALSDYDPPTKSEMDTGHGLLATEAKQDIIDTNVDQTKTAVITNAAGVDIAADIIAVKAETVLIVADTEDIQTQVGTAGAGLTDLGGMSTGMKAEVNAEVLDVENVDTVAEMAQGAPPETPTRTAMLNYLYRMWRNKTTATGSELAMYDNAGTTKLVKAVITKVGSLFTKGKMGTGL